ncbi:MAG: aminotransferase class I/II-fold pyridoxal phosphate-dependent enzyme [Flavobacteriaceae bacterium]|nr:aminotransferase class I/II-fold pyridoxal phosphate-dependent enzyme [Flavobacteriaceae bacterium]
MDIKVADRLKNVQEYYFSVKLREVAELKKQGCPIINIAIGSPDLSPPKAVMEELQKSLTLPNVHQYQSYQGIPELRSEITHFYQHHYGVTLNENEVLPLMGSKEGIMHISMAFLNQNDEVLIPNLGYPTYRSVTNLLQAIPLEYTLSEDNGWFPNLAEIEKKDLSKVKIMWVNYPHMPTGAKATKSQLEELVSFARKHQILLVNDNPYSFILNENPISILQIEGAKEVAIELNSLSKTFNMAGWRVGMVVGSKELLNKVLQVKSNMDSGMFLGIQKGAVKALQTDKKWLENQNKTYQKRREKVWEIFDLLGCSYDKNASGLFVWAKVPKGVKETDLIDDLLYKKHIFMTPGTVFGSAGKGFVRASLCVSLEEYDEVIRRILKG